MLVFERFTDNITDNDILQPAIDPATPRRKRERIAIHYQKTLHGLINYYGAPDHISEFVEACLMFHGYETGEWTATGAELAKAIALASTKDDRGRIRDRLAKQRKALGDWQNTRDEQGLPRPILVSIRPEYQTDDQKWKYWYSLPIATQIRDVIDLAPVGAADRRIRSAVATVAKEYLLSTGLRPPSRTAKRHHSAESQIARALTSLEKSKAELGEILFCETIKKRIFQNSQTLETLKLLNSTIGTIPMGVANISGDIPADIPAESGQSLAYNPVINIYAKVHEDEDGAAGGGAGGGSWLDDQFDPFEGASYDLEVTR